MKNTICILLLAGFVMPEGVPAQGTMFLSNLGEISTGSVSVGSDSWRAVLFRPGTNSGGYILNSVQLLMAPAIGIPSGLAVSLYDYNGGYPGNSLGMLTGSDPVAGGVFTYSHPGIFLSSTSIYYIVVNSATPVAQGSYNWSIADRGYNSSDGWFLGGSYYSPDSSNILNWRATRLISVQFAVNATAIPEPSALALLCGGGFLLAARRCLVRPR